ncbi:LuxR C-terminal-related transcriptional regulator [Frankia sp. CiP1_Cm_nod2]|uniref:LuxR C-terminal-related transcriptional regulator n=1 Tax=Frankia sp. CiP1_Cm_nod2 TaxID=2897161 RepID=UPI0020242E5F
MPLTDFVGRQSDIVALAGLVMRERLVTATGPGGCGKTRLADQVMARLAECRGEVFPAGLFWLSCGDLTDASLLPSVLIAALGMPDRFDVAPLERVADQLGERRLLVVLDDCDRVADAVQALASVLLPRCGGVHLLATSRVRLGVGAEVAWRVPPMTQADAVELFLARAGAEIGPSTCVTAVDGGVPVSPAPGAELDRHLVAEVCARLDGLPLAIELAAARTRVLSLPEIARGVDDRLKLLAGGSRFAPRRHRTIRACIDWSYDLLDELGRILLRRLAVFAGGARMAEVEAVCAFGALAREDVLEALTTLVDHSLVVTDRRAVDSRYQLLDTVAAYARERLDASGEAGEVQRRHGGLGSFGDAEQTLTDRRARMTAAVFDAADESAKLDGPTATASAGRSRGSRRRPALGWAALTPAEREVARAVARGLSNPAVGRALAISLSTVKTHLAHVFGKLNVANRVELAAFVLRADDPAGYPPNIGPELR